MKISFSIALFGISYATSPRDLVFPLVPVGQDVLGLVATTSSGQSRLLRLETRTNSIFLRNTENTLSLSLTPANGSPIQITRPNLSLVLDNSAPSGILGLCRGSVFANMFGSFMLLPEESTGGPRLIAAPTDPAQYCFDREIAYVPSLSSKIEAVVHFIYDGENFSHTNRVGSYEFVLRTGISNDFVDPILYADIARIIQSNPNRRITDNAGSSALVHGCTEDLLNELPSIKYSIIPDGQLSISADTALEIVISPQDYLQEVESGVCALRIQPGQDTSTLGMNFLSKVGVVFDYANRRIGFCDPL